MAFDYANSQATAARLIANFGQSASIRRVTNSGDAYSPTQSAADTAVTCVVTDYAHRERDGTYVQARDRKVYVAAEGLAITPTPGDKFVLGAMVYDIVHVGPLEPGGTVILFELQVRF